MIDRLPHKSSALKDTSFFCLDVALLYRFAISSQSSSQFAAFSSRLMHVPFFTALFSKSFYCIHTMAYAPVLLSKFPFVLFCVLARPPLIFSLPLSAVILLPERSICAYFHSYSVISQYCANNFTRAFLQLSLAYLFLYSSVSSCIISFLGSVFSASCIFEVTRAQYQLTVQ